MRRLVQGALWVGIGLVVVSGPARASNQTHERTPVIWDPGEAACGLDDQEAACGIVIDRSNQTTWNLPYGIPFEDTEVGMDEVVDSRRHQFFAFCRQRPPIVELLPVWITDADAQAASEVITCFDPDDDGPEECGPLVDPDSLTAEDILETSVAWEDCWHRINADDMRRPITCAQADEGVDWALAGPPQGVYVVEGYTWEPALNKWWQRPGFIKIVDDPNDPQQDLPAAAMIVEGDGIVYSNETTELEACIDALEGSSMRLEWGLLPNGPGEVEWSILEDELPAPDGSFTLEFVLPEEAEGEFIILRLTVEDPMGRRWVAYTHREMGVLQGLECPDGPIKPPECEDTGGDETDTGDGDADESDSGNAATETTASADDGKGDSGSGSSCACSARESSAMDLAMDLAWLGLLVFLRRRRA